MLDSIDAVVRQNAGEVRSFLDLFCGSGVVSQHFKRKGCEVFSNDSLYFCYVLQRGTTALNRRPSFKALGIADPIGYLNALELSQTPFGQEDCFILNNYSPVGLCKRMYFQPRNALKIDIIRLTIEQWRRQGLVDADAYYYLLASLLNAVPYVANITGVYAAYLKFWDKRTFNLLTLSDPAADGTIFDNQCRNQSFNCDYHDLLNKECDLLYADPPYNQREYLPNYHILETIALYDYPKVNGISGMREHRQVKSPFCSRKTVRKAFEDLLEACQSKYVLISYNNEGLMPADELAAMCRQYAVGNSFKLVETSYRRYKNKIPSNKKGLKEQLYFLQRK